MTADVPPQTPAPGDDALWVNARLVIPSSELAWRFGTSGGPGGQHANTANTRATVTFDIAGSTALTPHQRGLLVGRLGEEITVSVADDRSQTRNRDLARERLADKLRAALHVDPPRRPTRPTRASKERRLGAKARRADTKSARRRPSSEE